MQRVHPGHGEVEEEEDLRLLRGVRCEGRLRGLARLRVNGWIDEFGNVEARSRDVVLVPLLLVLNRLDSEEGHTEQRRQNKEDDEEALLAHLGRPDRERHEEA